MTGMQRRACPESTHNKEIVGAIIYFAVGYPLVNEIWPDSNAALWGFILVGVVGGYLLKRRQRKRNYK